MAGRIIGMIPGMGLLRQAYDATKLAGAIMANKKERALVLAEERHKAMAQYKDKNANKKLKELFEAKKYDEVILLYVPAGVVAVGKDFIDFWWKVWDIYWIFVLLRIMMVFMPQPGYIHPDEFFQTVEVVTGDVLATETTRTWEFNVTAPIRSMALPHLLFGTPLQMLKLMDYVLFQITGWSMIGPSLVFLLPRLVMLALSFVIDWCVYQICKLYRHNFNQCLTTLSSSYVILIYGTRTFSNSIELVLMSLLYYLVAHCMKRTSETVYLQSLVQESYESAETIKEKVQIKKKSKIIPGHNFKHFLPISIVCAFGFFNRPTFVLFAFVPLFFWFMRGVAMNSSLTPFQVFNFRCLSLVPGFFVTSTLIFLYDSLYYGELTLTKLWNLSMDWTDWKFTPFHFVMYNMVPGNLDQHGTHPLYLHTLVNIPLLYGPLGIAALFSAVNYFSEIAANDWRHKPSVINVYAMTMFSFVTGLGFLSLFPHQEPRFLIPLTVPIVLMNAHKLRHKTFNKWKPLLTLWYVFNISLVVFFGFIHQAGVHGVVKHISKDMTFPVTTMDANFVFSHVYMPPKFPVLQISSQKLLSKQETNSGDFDYPSYFHRPNNLKINFKDLAGTSIQDGVKKELLTLATRARESKKRGGRNIENYLVLPSHLIDDLEDCLNGTFFFKSVYRVFPHVSSESLPNILEPLLPFIHFDGHLTSPSDVLSVIGAFFSDAIDIIGQFSLSMYKFELKEGVKVVELENFTLGSSVAKSKAKVRQGRLAENKV